MIVLLWDAWLYIYLCLIEAIWGYSEKKSWRRNSRKEAREAIEEA